MARIEVLSPVADTRAAETPLASRSSELAGKTIGFLNNRKANAGLLLEEVERGLLGRWGSFLVVKGEKNASLAAPEEVLARLSRCDAVVVAIGD